MAAVAWTTLLVAVAGPARACSCIQQSETDALANADAAFIGSLVGYAPLDEFNRVSIWRVSSVFKGAIAPEQPVETAANGAACGLEAIPGQTYLVFAVSSTETGIVASYSAGLCGGTREAAAGERPAGFPAPSPPTGSGLPGTAPTTARPTTTRRTSTALAATTTLAATTSTEAVVAATEPTTAEELPTTPAGSESSRGWLAAVAIGAIVAIAGGLWWWPRRRREFVAEDLPPDALS